MAVRWAEAALSVANQDWVSSSSAPTGGRDSSLRRGAGSRDDSSDSGSSSTEYGVGGREQEVLRQEATNAQELTA